ncbi:MAG: hypothetical protein HYR51_10130 [Candidatus Rokubacteria bacterium]|nr:hypothetical protein [Candidatus Rokubacteria bacterium]
MSRLEDIEREIRALSPTELAEFRAWFAEFDWAAWDVQIARDVAAGKLDKVADEALRDHESGRTRPL